MGCRSLGFAAVASESSHWALRWASPISLSPDCVTGLRGGLELGRAPAPRTGVAHMIDDLRWVLRWIAVGCGGIVMVGLWVFSWWFAVDLQWRVCICSDF